MNWLFDHTEVITLIVIGLITISLLGVIFFYGAKDTPEVSDLQGFPETLGDFPPLPTMIETELMKSLSLEELEKILKGEK